MQLFGWQVFFGSGFVFISLFCCLLTTFCHVVFAAGVSLWGTPNQPPGLQSNINTFVLRNYFEISLRRKLCTLCASLCSGLGDPRRSPPRKYIYIYSRSIKVAISALSLYLSFIFIPLTLLFAVLMLLAHLVCYFIKLNVLGFLALSPSASVCV